jgi:prepilin-type N-terminal cleavage/methylation domain-containing protein
MMFRKLRLFHQNRAGWTLIELLVAIALTGMIALGASVSTAQVMNSTTRNNNFTTASRNAMNALHWMSRDAEMAQTINGIAAFPVSQNLSMTWKGWDNTAYTANYTLVAGQLKRIFTAGSTTSTTVIAEYINSSAQKTFCSSANGTINITVTSSVGSGARVIDVKQERQISSRPNL